MAGWLARLLGRTDPAPLRPEVLEVPIPPLQAISGSRVVAIDFETANASRASPCSIGLAWISGGAVTHRAYRLIRPLGNQFDGMNISIHGIYPEDVSEAPEFPEVWGELKPHFDGATVLAHNGAFDFGVLRETLDLYRLPYPRMECFCTLVAARRLWPALPNHKLHTVAEHVGFTFNHHHAGEDAYACAMISIHQHETAGTGDFAALSRATGTRLGRMSEEGYVAHTKLDVRDSKLWAPDPSADASHPLYGKRIVFTGTLEEMTREEAASAVGRFGGECQDAVTKKTDFLVVAAEPGMTKVNRAKALQKEGGRIRILSEAEFVRLLAH